MSKWYCPLPFRHAYIDSTGISPCCQIPRSEVSLDDWPKNPKLIEIQQDLLNGQQPEDCHMCVNNEQAYGTSLRTYANQDYNNQVFTDTKIDFIDFRSINICNFKCRSCGPVFSHGIAQEVNNYAELGKFFWSQTDGKTAAVTEVNIDWIMRNLGSLKKIMLTGGEPTVIPGVRDLITKIKQDHKDINVLITTNASFQDDFWFEITEQLPHLHWTVSIDAVGPTAEIIRHGTDWSVVERNVTWLAGNAPSLNINSVISNLSVFGLKPLLEFGSRMQKIGVTTNPRQGWYGIRHQFHVCQRPEHLSADNLTEELQIQAITYLKSCLALELDDEQKNTVTGLIAQIQSAEFDPELWARSQNYNQLLNQIRNENHLTLFTEQTY
jgi:pyruvate-formate lyase-activating enzyme